MNRLSEIILTLALVSILSSCNKKESTTIPVKENTQIDVFKLKSENHKRFLKKIRLRTNRIEVCSYKLTGKRFEDTTKVIRRINLVTPEKLKTFNTWFDTLRVGGYCCCPKTHYTIKLFDKNKMLRIYNVDTTEIEGNAFIYDRSYQTNYIISLKNWNNWIE